MKKLFFLLLSVGISTTAIKPEQKDWHIRKQKAKEFLTTKPMMVMYGAIGGGVAVKVFMYDALRNENNELKRKTDEKIQKLEQERVLIAGATFFYHELKKNEDMKGLLQKIAEVQQEFLKLSIKDDAFILSAHDAESLEALQILNQLKESLQIYNEIASQLNEEKIDFQDYNQDDKQGIIFTDLAQEPSSQSEQSSTPIAPNHSAPQYNRTMNEIAKSIPSSKFFETY